MYAIVETGGRQYRVEAGQNVDVEKLPAVVGDSVTLDRVLLVADGDRVTVGNPTVDGASVQATVVGQAKSRKAIIYKYLPRDRYRRRKGHRQPFTRLAISSIEL
jgi:large subunit ribosomal protein L21